jgi:hypothetical protein
MNRSKNMTKFKEFSKIPRLSRECIVTEKIDGTNASIFISDDGQEFLCGSRTRWITPEDDNYGFARWAHANKSELMQLGPGCHYGEWWGLGIQRNYGMPRKVFSLFNVARWCNSNEQPTIKSQAYAPVCCRVVPMLWQGEFRTETINDILSELKLSGSVAAPLFMRPEGIVIYHAAARMYFKKTIEKDDVPENRPAVCHYQDRAQ